MLCHLELRKLIDRHNRDGVWVERPIHQDEYAYKTGTSTETALHQLVREVEKTLENREVMLGTFLDIEGAFDNTSHDSMVRALRLRQIVNQESFGPKLI